MSSLKSLKAKINSIESVTYRVPMLKAKDISEITGETTTILIQNQLCKGCELCVTFCPEDILEMGTELNTKSYFFPHAIPNKEANCKQCRNCERVCPELSIFLLSE
ncbi:MAG: ferredoxin family protein [Candidatus Heimdallarchaeota archaeon]